MRDKIRKLFIESVINEMPHIEPAPNPMNGFDLGLEMVPKSREAMVNWFKRIFRGDEVGSRYDLDFNEPSSANLQLKTPEEKNDFWNAIEEDGMTKMFLKKYSEQFGGLTMEELKAEIETFIKGEKELSLVAEAFCKVDEDEDYLDFGPAAPEQVFDDDGKPQKQKSDFKKLNKFFKYKPAGSEKTYNIPMTTTREAEGLTRTRLSEGISAIREILRNRIISFFEKTQQKEINSVMKGFIDSLKSEGETSPLSNINKNWEEVKAAPWQEKFNAFIIELGFDEYRRLIESPVNNKILPFLGQFFDYNEEEFIKAIVEPLTYQVVEKKPVKVSRKEFRGLAIK